MAPSRNLILMAVSFMILFSAYNTLQNYATSLFPNGLGNQSLAVLYVVCAVSVFAGPAVVDALGPRLSMVVGAACYVAYIVSLVKIIPAVVLAMSAVIGFGAAILWIANGVYITMDTDPASYATATSTFWAVFQVCNILGNLATYLVFPHLSSTSALYLGFAVVAGVGTIGLMFLGAPASAKGSSQAQASKARKTCGQRMNDLARGAWSAAKLICEWRMLCICPLFFLSGYELAYWTGAFPQLLQPSVIGLVLAFAGVGEVMGAHLMGWVSDRVGRTASLALGTAFFSIALGLSGAMKVGVYVGPMLGGAPLGSYAAALGFGLGDSCFNTNAYAMCSQLHGNKEEAGGDSSPVKRASVSSAGQADVEEGLLAGQHMSTVDGAALGGAKGMATDPDPSVGSGTSDPDAQLSPLAGGAGGSAIDGTTTDGSASVGAFTVFQLLQNMGSALGFYLGLAWPLADLTDSSGNVTTKGTLYQTWLVTVLLVISFVTFAAVDASERRRKAGKARV